MNRPPSKISRLSELPREIPPPHDGWPALEAKLRESGRPQSGEGTGQGVTAPDIEPTSGRLAVAYISDPRFLREREALLRSLNGRLAKLPPPTRQKVLQSLATIHQSMQQIQQALGKEPGNALLQELLIDTYQNEMQVLSTVQAASGGTGET